MVIVYAVSPINTSAIESEALSLYNQTTQEKEIRDHIGKRVLAEQSFRLTALVVGYGLTPLLLSYLFTLNHPQHRLVPPLFLQIVAFALLIPYASLRFLELQSNYFALILVRGFFMIYAGWIQDGVMIRLLGRFVNRRDMETRGLKVEGTTLQDLEARLLQRALANSLHLRRTVERHDDGVILRTRSDADYACFIELKDHPDNDNSIKMNLVFFETDRYFTKTSPELVEHADGTVGHLIIRLMSPDVIVTREDSGEYPERLVTKATDELSGFMGRAQRMSGAQRTRMFVFLAAFLLPIVYYALYFDQVGAELFGLIATSIGIYATAITIDTSYTIRQQRHAQRQIHG